MVAYLYCGWHGERGNSKHSQNRNLEENMGFSLSSRRLILTSHSYVWPTDCYSVLWVPVFSWRQ